ncbi:MAG: MBL fold metallo-hydrolase [Candidatus Eisenbacteria bacterium]
MILDVLSVGPFQANCYLLGCPDTHEALIVDPGDEPERLSRRIEELNLRPTIYLHTHGHIDHVGASGPLKTRFGGRILLHEADRVFYEHAHEHAHVYGIEIPPTLPLDGTVGDGEELAWGAVRGTLLHTPGHSPGGMCLRVAGHWMGAEPGRRAAHGRSAHDQVPAAPPDWLFTGDTLFSGSVGRTDLPGGSWPALLRSVREKLLSLPDECVVAPGHGPRSTIGEERRLNPFLQERGLADI